jgi:hypothetical protein
VVRFFSHLAEINVDLSDVIPHEDTAIDREYLDYGNKVSNLLSAQILKHLTPNLGHEHQTPRFQNSAHAIEPYETSGMQCHEGVIGILGRQTRNVCHLTAQHLSSWLRVERQQKALFVINEGT